MTQMRQFVTVGGFAAALALAAVPAAAQTIIGGNSQPEVEVNLDVLNNLAPSAGSMQGTTDQQQPVVTTSNGSVLLIAPSSGGTTTTNTQPASSQDSVLLLDQPATTPPASTGEFIFPDVPGTKPAVPESAVVTSETQDNGETTVTTVTTVVSQPEPEPAPEPEAAPVPEPAPEVVTTTVTAEPAAPESEVAAVAPEANSGSDDAFQQIETMLNEPVAPEEIVVPEPDMEMDTTEVVSLPPSDVVMSNDMDLQILFDPGVDTMSDADQAQLDALAARLGNNPDQRIQLRAYASSDDGTASAARRLALARALQVRAYLIENGVRSTRIDVRALGDKVEDSGPLDRIDIVLVES